jgi:hypothetical protein
MGSYFKECFDYFSLALLNQCGINKMREIDVLLSFFLFAFNYFNTPVEKSCFELLKSECRF